MTIEDLHRKLSHLAISAMEDETLVVRKTRNGENLRTTPTRLKPDISRKRIYIQPSLFD
ncbi:hypothetical protein KCTC52924_03835 [Arenibacter antarcticus]|uniref:Uncharacterized protein n=1 Tax=Arenibacter antarcticus TaxID=2040469 RepID=A0ABW5VEH1_9FLAO|nr:hypothetical protein [Arenibacter sp. H213]